MYKKDIPRGSQDLPAGLGPAPVAAGVSGPAMAQAAVSVRVCVCVCVRACVRACMYVSASERCWLGTVNGRSGI